MRGPGATDVRAVMRQHRGTVWGNNVEIELSTDLDAPHKLSTAELAVSMILTMQVFMEQLRLEDERAIDAGTTLSAEMRDHHRRRAGGEQDREQQRLQEMRDARDQPQT